MLSDIWAFLQNENNRAVLAWAGGGIVVVIGALWSVLKFILSRREKNQTPPPTVSASHGGVSAGRDISGSKIDTRGEKER
jgi:hypothetical protein